MEHHPNSQLVCCTVLHHLEYSEYGGLDQSVHTGTTLHYCSTHYDSMASW